MHCHWASSTRRARAATAPAPGMPAGQTAQAGRARRPAPSGRRPDRSAGLALGMRPSTPSAPAGRAQGDQGYGIGYAGARQVDQGYGIGYAGPAQGDQGYGLGNAGPRQGDQGARVPAAGAAVGGGRAPAAAAQAAAEAVQGEVGRRVRARQDGRPGARARRSRSPLSCRVARLWSWTCFGRAAPETWCAGTAASRRRPGSKDPHCADGVFAFSLRGRGQA